MHQTKKLGLKQA